MLTRVQVSQSAVTHSAAVLADSQGEGNSNLYVEVSKETGRVMHLLHAECSNVQFEEKINLGIYLLQLHFTK